MKKIYDRPWALAIPLPHDLRPVQTMDSLGDEELARILRAGRERMMDTVYRTSQQAVLRQIADEWVLVPLDDLSVRWNGFFTLDTYSRCLWEEFSEPSSVRSVAGRMRQRFDDGGSGRIEADILRFADEFRMYNLLIKMEV